MCHKPNGKYFGGYGAGRPSGFLILTMGTTVPNFFLFQDASLKMPDLVAWVGGLHLFITAIDNNYEIIFTNFKKFSEFTRFLLPCFPKHNGLIFYYAFKAFDLFS